MTWVRSQLVSELRSMVERHVDALQRYFPCCEGALRELPDLIVTCLDQLVDIVQYPPFDLSHQRYAQLCEYHHTLLHFLHTLNQPIDTPFNGTQVGQLLTRTGDWLRASERDCLSQREVWEYIAPAKPDCLEAVGGGQYEARWWKPVPVMDIEILKRTDGIALQAEAYEPRHLTGGLAVRFSIVTGDPSDE